MPFDLPWNIATVGLVVFGSLAGWILVGCIVLTSIDDSEQRLFRWFKSAPYGIDSIVIIAWPAIAAVWLWRR